MGIGKKYTMSTRGYSYGRMFDYSRVYFDKDLGNITVYYHNAKYQDKVYLFIRQDIINGSFEFYDNDMVIVMTKYADEL